MTDYSELVERMRAYPSNKLCIQIANALEAQAKEIAELKAMHQRDIDCIKRASIRISELEAENKKLREKLKPFAYDVADCFQDDEDTEIPVNIRDIRAARATLNGEK